MIHNYAIFCHEASLNALSGSNHFICCSSLNKHLAVFLQDAMDFVLKGSQLVGILANPVHWITNRANQRHPNVHVTCIYTIVRIPLITDLWNH